MTKRQFRGLLGIYLASLVASVGVALIPGLVPASLEQALYELPDSHYGGALAASIVFGLPLIIGSIASIVGLFVFAPWARSLSLAITVAGFLLYPLLGPTVSSGIADSMHDATSMLWGAILAVIYFSPISSDFASQRKTGP